MSHGKNLNVCALYSKTDGSVWEDIGTKQLLDYADFEDFADLSDCSACFTLPKWYALSNLDRLKLPASLVAKGVAEVDLQYAQ